ncbi:MAG: radical SAM protein, partial [Alistipes sp.]|nr:radical SAM protein [Alistipes sp.]
MGKRSVEFTYEDIVKRNERRGFTSMVKPVGSLCNMRCKYCYYLDKAELYNHHQPMMDDKLLENYIRANIDGNNSPVIAFAWHGGEPLLAGKEFFRKAVALQQKYAEGRTVENSIQTNGLLIDDEWCAILRDNNFLVGVSIDGPE